MTNYSEVSKEELDDIRQKTTIINGLKIVVSISNEDFLDTYLSKNESLIEELTEAWTRAAQFGWPPVGTTFTVDEYDFHGELFQYDLVQDTDLTYTKLHVWVK